MFIFNFIDVRFDFNRDVIENWLYKVIQSEQKSVGQITYVFCNDQYLLDINQRFLNHDTYTDIITFDNTIGDAIGGDIFISSDRVMENASSFKVSFEEELLRVLVHGVLHLCGFKDKSDVDSKLMRAKENEKIDMFHVEQRG